jgi:hypothetical protein
MTVVIGGVPVTVAQACAAATALEASRTTAVAPVIARTALAGCDVSAAVAPFTASRRASERGTGRGCRGRHVTRLALTDAIASSVRQAVASARERALRAIGSDERYATAIVASASSRVSARERAAA